MYGILSANNEVKERREVVQRPHYKKPELLATAPTRVLIEAVRKNPNQYHSCMQVLEFYQVYQDLRYAMTIHFQKLNSTRLSTTVHFQETLAW